MSFEGIWYEDQYGAWNLRIGSVHAWITKRPTYCDRGHFMANVSGIPSIDEADSFPRYYMDETAAKNEMGKWLEWRLQCEQNRVPVDSGTHHAKG